MYRALVLTGLLVPAVAGSAASQLSRPNEVDPAKLEVEVGKAGLDESGFVHIVGEIRNNTGGWIESTRINVDLLDSEGKSLLVRSIATAVAEDLGEAKALDFTYAHRYFVPPGEVTPFHYLRDAKKIGGVYASYALHVAAMQIPAAESPKVVIERLSTTTDEKGARIVSGVIVNQGSVGCRSPEAIVGVYDADGTLYRVEDERPETYRSKVLPAGESVVFRVRFFNDEEEGDMRAFADCDPID